MEPERCPVCGEPLVEETVETIPGSGYTKYAAIRHCPNWLDMEHYYASLDPYQEELDRGEDAPTGL